MTALSYMGAKFRNPLCKTVLSAPAVPKVKTKNSIKVKMYMFGQLCFSFLD